MRRNADHATFDAVVLPNNHAMIDVFRDSGFPVRRPRGARRDRRAAAPTAITPQEARGFFEDRDRLTAVAAVRYVLAPRSIGLLGATSAQAPSGRPSSRNLRAGYPGLV